MNRAMFYRSIRPMFHGMLSQQQVDGIEALLAATEGLPITHRAYLMATAAHETDQTMQPITEYGGRKYFEKYDTGKIAKALGNTPEADGDGYLYRGRGYVQLTGRANYAKAGAALGLGLMHKPDLALQPAVAAKILVRGCEGGWFTGKRLSDYLPGDYRGARKIVNGTDKADLIAGYAREFEAALLLLPDAPVTSHISPVASGADIAPIVTKTPTIVGANPGAISAAKPSILARLIAWLFGKGA